MAESTHKHRNVIDDILDVGLGVGCIAYYVFHEQVGINLTDEQLVSIGAVGATMRASVRRILMKIWGPSLGVSEGPAESDDSGGEEDEEDADDGEDGSDDSGDEDADGDAGGSSDETQEAPKIAPPPKVGG